MRVQRIQIVNDVTNKYWSTYPREWTRRTHWRLYVRTIYGKYVEINKRESGYILKKVDWNNVTTCLAIEYKIRCYQREWNKQCKHFGIMYKNMRDTKQKSKSRDACGCAKRITWDSVSRQHIEFLTDNLKYRKLLSVHIDKSEWIR